MENFDQQAAAYALSWSVLHSFWQAGVFFVTLKALLIFFPKDMAYWRYRLALGALLLIFISFLLTILTVFQQYNLVAEAFATNPVSLAEAPVLRINLRAQEGFTLSPFLIKIISRLWLVGFIIYFLRLMAGIIYLKQLQFRGVVSAPFELVETLQRVAKRMRLSRKIPIVLSSKITSPSVIGIFRPMILFPVGMLNGLSTLQVEAILAHEIKHIARHDYLFNLVQSFIEAVMYFNPVVWIVSSIIREERESHCDLAALQTGVSAMDYSKALLHFQAQTNLRIALTGSRPVLLRRIKRLFPTSSNHPNMLYKFISALCLIMVLGVMLLGAGLPSEEKTSATEGAPALQENYLIPESAIINQDSLPKGNFTLKMPYRGKSYHLKVKDQKITALSIDGTAVPQDSLQEYEDLAEELIDNVPAPPAPPMPPQPIEIVSPVPPLPAPPIPPAPPLPKGIDDWNLSHAGLQMELQSLMHDLGRINLEEIPTIEGLTELNMEHLNELRVVEDEVLKIAMEKAKEAMEQEKVKMFEWQNQLKESGIKEGELELKARQEALLNMKEALARQKLEMEKSMQEYEKQIAKELERLKEEIKKKGGNGQ